MLKSSLLREEFLCTRHLTTKITGLHCALGSADGKKNHKYKKIFGAGPCEGRKAVFINIIRLTLQDRCIDRAPHKRRPIAEILKVDISHDLEDSFEL